MATQTTAAHYYTQRCTLQHETPFVLLRKMETNWASQTNDVHQKS